MSAGSIDPNRILDLTDKRVVVQVKDDMGDGVREIEGKVLASDRTGLVIQTRSGTSIINTSEIEDIEVIVPNMQRRLIKRWIQEIEPGSVRQHLVDRHGMPFDLINALPDGNAVQVHNQLPHGNLGHDHGNKPSRRKSAKPEVIVDLLSCASCGAEGPTCLFEAVGVASPFAHCGDCMDTEEYTYKESSVADGL